MGFLVLVRDNQFKILELFRCNSELGVGTGKLRQLCGITADQRVDTAS